VFDAAAFDVRVNFDTGFRAFEITTPTRANGAKVTMERLSWPAGALFRWDVYERERNGTLTHLAGADELGGPAVRRDGLPGDAPLVITLRWAADRDKDVIRFEVTVEQDFSSNVSLEWL
jgi:hypothetical protein